MTIALFATKSIAVTIR